MSNSAVNQSVFNSKDAIRIAKIAFAEAENDLYNKHLRGDFDDGDPNHPKYNNGYNYATMKFVNLFGYSQDGLLAKQY